MNALVLPWADDAETVWSRHCRHDGEVDWRASCDRLVRERFSEQQLPTAERQTLVVELERRRVLPDSASWRGSMPMWRSVVYVNLTAAILDPYEPGARIDYAALKRSAEAAVRYASQAYVNNINTNYQSIEIGILGLADALVLLGHCYDSWTARGVALDLLATLRNVDGTDPLVFTLAEDPLASALAGSLAGGVQPLSRHQPSYARSLWLHRYGPSPWPHALRHAEDPAQQARRALANVLEPWLKPRTARAR